MIVDSAGRDADSGAVADAGRDARAGATMSRGRVGWLDGVALAIAAAIAYASLAQGGAPSCADFVARHFLRESGRLSGWDFLANVSAYAVLGTVLALAHARRTGGDARAAGLAGLATVLGCAALALAVESAQACLPARVSSGWDLLANTSGAALGWGVGWRLLPAWDRLTGRIHGGEQRRLVDVVLLATAGWTVAETAPWVPATAFNLVRQNVAQLWIVLGTGQVDPWTLAQGCAAWLAIGLTLSLPLARAGHAVALFWGFALLVTVLRLLVQGSTPSAEWVLSLPPGLFVTTAVVHGYGRRTRALLALAAVFVAMLAYELQPAYGVMQPFGWAIGLLLAHPVPAIQLAAFFGWFAATVVACGRVAGLSASRCALGATAALAGMEWAQTMIPGRTPDLSPVIVAALCGWVAARMLDGTATGVGAPVRPEADAVADAGPATPPR